MNKSIKVVAGILFGLTGWLACAGRGPGGDDACTENSQCSNGELCIEGACVLVCSNDAQCDPTEQCSGGTCEPVANPTCTSHVECDAGDPCAPLAIDRARCVAGECDVTCKLCVNDTECPRCQTCDAGQCSNQPAGQDFKNECNADSGCGTGACDGSGACDVEAAGTDCGVCRSCSTFGLCLTNSLDHADCGTCEKCDAGACVPQSASEDLRNECTPDAGCGSGFCNGARACDLTPGVVCRPAVDDCDYPEVCTSSGTCPTDTVQPTTYECRPAAGACDLAENCNGVNMVCPGDNVVGAGTQCGFADNVCDVNDFCDGVSADCPANYAPSGTFCGAGSCYRCNGAGSCGGCQNDGCSLCTSDAACCSGSCCTCNVGFCSNVRVCKDSSMSCSQTCSALCL